MFVSAQGREGCLCLARALPAGPGTGEGECPRDCVWKAMGPGPCCPVYLAMPLEASLWSPFPCLPQQGLSLASKVGRPEPCCEPLAGDRGGPWRVCGLCPQLPGTRIQGHPSSPPSSLWLLHLYLVSSPGAGPLLWQKGREEVGPGCGCLGPCLVGFLSGGLLGPPGQAVCTSRCTPPPAGV